MSPRLRIREQRQLARTYARTDALTHMAHPRTLLQDFPSHSNGNNTTISCPRSELHTEFDFEAAQAPEGIDARGGGFGDDLFPRQFQSRVRRQHTASL